jgi:hypothetical protein
VGAIWETGQLAVWSELGSRSLVGFLSLFFGKGFGLVSLREMYVAAIFFLSFLLACLLACWRDFKTIKVS